MKASTTSGEKQKATSKSLQLTPSGPRACVAGDGCRRRWNHCRHARWINDVRHYNSELVLATCKQRPSEALSPINSPFLRVRSGQRGGTAGGRPGRREEPSL